MTKIELYEALLKEKDRTIAALTELIDYQRTQTGTTPIQAQSEFDPFEFTQQAWVTDEEQDIKQLVENGQLTREEADAALAELLNVELQLG